MDLGLVLAKIHFLLEPLIAFLALERLFKFFKKAPPPLFWRVDDGIGITCMRLDHDD
jgi:hypothetical protein